VPQRIGQPLDPKFPDLNQALGLKQVQKFTFVKSFRISVHSNADFLAGNCSIITYYAKIFGNLP